MTTQTLDASVETTEQTSTTEPGDHDTFSHYVRKAQMEEYYLLGRPAIALCGKTWVPKKDPSRYPVCGTCREIFEQMKPGGEA